MLILLILLVSYPAGAVKHVIYRNTNSGVLAFMKLNENGTVDNSTGSESFETITSSLTVTPLSYQGATTNNSSLTKIIMANSDESRYMAVALNANGTLKNETDNDGLSWIHSSDLNLSAWSFIGVQENANHSDGLSHLIFQNTSSGNVGFLRLNSNGTIKSETPFDGYSKINIDIDIPTAWRAFDIQENADGLGFDHILLRNTSTGKSAYIKLNANGTIKNTTRNDGWGLLFPSGIGNYIPVAVDTLTSSGLMFKYSGGGTQAFAYAKLNSNGSLSTPLTRGTGWDFLQTTYDISGFDVVGFMQIGSDDAVLIRAPWGSRAAWFKLNANGTAQNTTLNQGAAWISSDQSSEWRVEGIDPADY